MSKVNYEAMTDEELNLAIAVVKSGTPKEEQRFKPPDYVHDAAATWRALVEMPWPKLDQDRWAVHYGWRCLCSPSMDTINRTIEAQDSNPARAAWLCWLNWKKAQEAGSIRKPAHECPKARC